MLKSAFSVSAMTLLSRIFGFVRDILMAGIFGAGVLSDAFFVAFRLPNMFRSLLAEGAFNNAFVPLFTKQIAQNGTLHAQKFAGQVITLMVVVATALSALFVWQMPAIMSILAHGYVNTPQFSIIVQAGQILFPYLLFVMVMAQLAGMLNSVQKFWASAFAPVLFNVGFVAVLAGIYYGLNTPQTQFQPTAHHVYILSYGVLGAGAIQLAWIVLYAHRVGILPKPQMPKFTAPIKRLFATMAPGVLGAGVYHVNLVFSTLFATMVGAGSVSYLAYAERLFQLPVGLVGVAISVVLLPTLSTQLANNQIQNANHTQNRALEMGMLFALPATGAMVVMAYELIGGLFIRGNFAATHAQTTADVLSLMVLAIPAYVALKILTPSFYARHNTKTPVLYSAISVAVNIVLAWAWLTPHGLYGIVGASVISAWLNVLLVGATLIHKSLWHPDTECQIRTAKIILCTMGMMVVLYALGTILHTTTFPLWAIMLMQIAVGGATYAILILATQTITLAMVKQALKK